MKIGIYGGSFSPVHIGHLILAESCRQHLQLDQVWFVPAAVSPLKQDVKMASDTDRLMMLELAINGNSAFRIEKIELERGGVSYTADTLQAITEAHPGHQFHLLIGGDSYADLHLWNHIQQIAMLAKICVVDRPGTDLSDRSHLQPLLSDEIIDKIQQHFVPSPLIEISSREIRNAVSAGQSIRYLVPRPVEMYIETQKLFR